MRYQGNGFAPLAGGLTLRKESLCAEWWLKELWKLPLVVPSPLSLDKKVFEGFFFCLFYLAGNRTEPWQVSLPKWSTLHILLWQTSL